MQEADVKYTYPQTSNTLTRRHAGGPEAALDEWVCAGPCRNLKDKCRNVALGLHVCSRIMFLPVRAPHAPAGTQAHAPGREFVQTHRTGAALPLLLQTADVVLHPSSMRHVIALWLVVLLLNLEKLLQPPWTPCAGGAEDSQGRISGGERIGVLNRTFPSPGHATAISGASDECAHCGAVASSPSGAFGRAAVSDAILASTVWLVLCLKVFFVFALQTFFLCLLSRLVVCLQVWRASFVQSVLRRVCHTLARPP